MEKQFTKKRTKLNTIGSFESKSYYLDPIEIEKGIIHEWFILVEEIENEEIKKHKKSYNALLGRILN